MDNYLKRVASANGMALEDVDTAVTSALSVTTEGEGDDSPALQKLAFEVMYRIGRVTPVTPIAIVSISLLAARGKARTAGDVMLPPVSVLRSETVRDAFERMLRREAGAQEAAGQDFVGRVQLHSFAAILRHIQFVTEDGAGLLQSQKKQSVGVIGGELYPAVVFVRIQPVIMVRVLPVNVPWRDALQT